MYVRDEVFPRQPIGWKDQREVGTDYVAIQQVVIVSKCLNPSQVLNPDLWITENDKGHRLIIRSLQLPPAPTRERLEHAAPNQGRPGLATFLSAKFCSVPHQTPIRADRTAAPVIVTAETSRTPPHPPVSDSWRLPCSTDRCKRPA